ncbi:MAG: nucleotidyltransferase domain-containing protein [Clostridium sp.]|uniref:nucleotidyltransferase domain-containing protein n=1 Tax=Clostridium sp. TaxID=1506 RepID=UPI00302773B8
MKLVSKSGLDIDMIYDVISLCTFGSYNESCWDKERSDIDVMVLSNEELEWNREIEIEDYLTNHLSGYFNHDNIHITFINDVIYPFGEIMIASPNKFILQEEKYLDYILAYSCFKRDREYLEIIRDYHLKERGV